MPNPRHNSVAATPVSARLSASMIWLSVPLCLTGGLSAEWIAAALMELSITNTGCRGNRQKLSRLAHYGGVDSHDHVVPRHEHSAELVLFHQAVF